MRACVWRACVRACVEYVSCHPSGAMSIDVAATFWGICAEGFARMYLSSRYNLERKHVVVDNFNALHKPFV